MRRKSLLMLSLMVFGMVALAGCAGKIPAKIVEPGKAYSTQNYGVCFDVKNLQKLNHHCNIEITH